MAIRRWLPVLPGLLVAAVHLHIQAQPEPLGDEFQVNTYTTSQQGQPSVASDGNGNFVVVWHSLGSYGIDTYGYSIQGQRYSSDGVSDGVEFQVNGTEVGPFTYVGYMGNQLRPRTAMDGAGNFVVVWDSYDSGGTDDSETSVQGRRYDSNGDTIDGEFQVNTYTTSLQRFPDVSLDSAGNFVVVWESYGSSGTDSSYASIQGQLYDFMGDPAGSEFQVNTYTSNIQLRPTVASRGGGEFVVLWQSIGSSGTDTSSYSIQGQRYDSFGNQLDPPNFEFQVNTYTTSNQSSPSVAIDPSGNFVVVWQSQGSSGTDTSSYSIQGQRYDFNGVPAESEFQVNTYTSSAQTFPRIAFDSDGKFVVVWQSYGSSGTDSDFASIQGQRYDAMGDPVESEFQVNSYTTSAQKLPAVTFTEPNEFVVVWQSYGQDGAQGSIQGQRFRFYSNVAPTANDDSYTVDEDTMLVADDSAGGGDPNDDSVLVNDSDPESLALSVSSNLDPMEAGLLGGTVDLESDGTFTYSPPANMSGVATFVYEITDGELNDSAAVAITVNPVNDPPTFTPGPSIEVEVNSGSYSESWASNISAGPVDESGQVLSFDVQVTGTNGTIDFSSGPAISADGTLSFVPMADGVGVATVEATLMDDGGGDDSSATVQFEIEVTGPFSYYSGFEN